MSVNSFTWRGLVLSTAIVAITVACHSSPAGPSTSVTFNSTASLDGWVQSDGVAVANQGGPLVGDLDDVAPGVGYRQFYSFDLSTIPAGSHIVSATLRLYQAVASQASYTKLGTLIVDRVDLGAALDSTDYNAVALKANIGTLSTTTTIEYKTLDVTAAVQADVDTSRGKSQFRVRFSLKDSNNDGVRDYVQLTEAEDSCCSVSKPPELVIEYRMS
jgi:hypothetical protein